MPPPGHQRCAAVQPGDLRGCDPLHYQAAIAWPLLVLLGLTVVFMGAGVFRVRYE